MIRHADRSERRKLHDWLQQSHQELRAQNSIEYPMETTLDWQEFLSSFEEYFYMKEGRKYGSMMIITHGNEEVGCICYSAAFCKRRTVDFDFWLKSASLYGQGIEVQALRDTAIYLNKELGFRFFLGFPPEVDLRGIRIFKEAGFTYRSDKVEVVKRHFKPEYVEQFTSDPIALERSAAFTLEIPLPV